MDTVPNSKRSEIMRRVKNKDTKIEREVRLKLWHSGIRYVKHPKGCYGNPDLVVRGQKIVIFIDSCFWHGCPTHLRMPHTNQDYWRKKIERNIKRDRTVDDYYSSVEWKVMRIWEHDVHDLTAIIECLKTINR